MCQNNAWFGISALDAADILLAAVSDLCHKVALAHFKPFPLILLFRAVPLFFRHFLFLSLSRVSFPSTAFLVIFVSCAPLINAHIFSPVNPLRQKNIKSCVISGVHVLVIFYPKTPLLVGLPRLNSWSWLGVHFVYHSRLEHLIGLINRHPVE